MGVGDVPMSGSLMGSDIVVTDLPPLKLGAGGAPRGAKGGQISSSPPGPSVGGAGKLRIIREFTGSNTDIDFTSETSAETTQSQSSTHTAVRDEKNEKRKR